MRWRNESRRRKRALSTLPRGDARTSSPDYIGERLPKTLAKFQEDNESPHKSTSTPSPHKNPPRENSKKSRLRSGLHLSNQNILYNKHFQ
ncbi:hypothetical protein NPIL_45251 [Nephila pilipes]|uniref:Uncharacterized protein n=1 Tax=Nephila pilipes TaxID=299642 RepID=A0A8X6P2Z1_NEPPI|nr:hypothetical protein NPIL_45251 [Nephila pilipes]